MGLFGKKNNDETKCNKCDLEFSSSERVRNVIPRRHTARAQKLRSKRKHGEASKLETERTEM